MGRLSNEFTSSYAGHARKSSVVRLRSRLYVRSDSRTFETNHHAFIKMYISRKLRRQSIAAVFKELGSMIINGPFPSLFTAHIIKGPLRLFALKGGVNTAHRWQSSCSQLYFPNSPIDLPFVLIAAVGQPRPLQLRACAVRGRGGPAALLLPKSAQCLHG